MARETKHTNRWARALRRVALSVMGIALAVVAGLQTPWGSQWAGSQVLQRADPFVGATLEAGSVRGSWITSLEIHDLTLVRGDSAKIAHVDTVRLRYSLLPLLWGSMHLRSLAINGFSLRMSRTENESWDLLGLLPQDTTANASGRFTVRVDTFAARRLRLTAALAPDSLFTAEVDHLAGTARSGGTFALAVDTAVSRLHLPGSAEQLALRMRGAYADGNLTLDGVHIEGANTRVHVWGHAGVGRRPYDIDLTLDASALGDLAPYLPSFVDRKSAASIRAKSAGDLVHVTASATLANGVGLALEGRATPAIEGGVEYSIEHASVDGAFGNGEMRGHLQGPDLYDLSGALRLDLSDNSAVGPASLEVTLDGGTAAVHLVAEAGLSITGTARPLDPAPTYDFAGRFDSLDIGRFLDGHGSALSGTLRVTGAGADASAHAVLTHSRLNRLELVSGHLEATLAGGALEAAWRVQPDSGSVQGRLHATLGDTVQYSVPDLSIQGLDIAALAGVDLPSHVSAVLSLRGEGQHVRDIRLDIFPSAVGAHPIHSARIQGRLESGLLALHSDADLELGSFTLPLLLRPFDTHPSFTLAAGSFRNIDLAALTGNRLHSDLSGTLSLVGNGLELQTMDLSTVRLALRDSYINDQAVDSAVVDARLQQGILTLDARMDLPNGHARFSVGGRPFGDTAVVAMREGIFSGLDLGALLGVTAIKTDLHGIIDTLAVRGDALETATAVASLQLDSSRINGGAVQGGEIHASLGRGVLSAQADLDLAEGHLRLDSLVARLFDERPAYAASGSVRNIDLGRFLVDSIPNILLNGRFDIAGEGQTAETLTLARAHIDASGSQLGDLSLDSMRAALRMADGTIHVDTLLVASSAAHLHGGGSITLFGAAPKEALLVMHGSIRDARPLRSLGVPMDLRGDTLWATVHSRQDTLLIVGSAEASSIQMREVRVLGMDAGISAMLARDPASKWKPASVDVRATLRRASVPALAAQQAVLDISLRGDSLRYMASVTLDDQRNALLEGRADVARREATIETLDVTLGNDHWGLDQPAGVSFGDAYRVNNLLMVEENQEIALDGVINLSGGQSLGLTVYNFRVGAVADLFELHGLDGTVNGQLFLRGPATAPVLDGSVDFAVEAHGEAVGTMRVSTNYADQRLGVEAALTHRDASTFAMSGHLPVDFRLAEGGAAMPVESSDVALSVRADSFNVGWIEPFLDPAVFGDIEGRLTAQVIVEGTLERPGLIGSAALDRGQLGLPLLGITLADVEGTADFAGDSVFVRTVTARSGDRDDGLVTAQGSIALESLTLGAIDLVASADAFRAIDTPLVTTNIDADVHLRGTTAAPVLTGSLHLENGDIRPLADAYDQDYGPVVFTEEDVRMLEHYFNVRVTDADTTTFEFLDALAMDLDVVVGEDVWIVSRHNPEMNILLAGALALNKASNAEMELAGTVEIIPDRSYLRQFSRRFDITAGRVTFAGDIFDALLDIQATYAISELNSTEHAVTIIMAVQGHIQEPQLELRSEPTQLDQADIISYIASGKPAAESFQLSRGGTLESGTNLALAQLTNLIANAAGEELGLDIMEIHQEGARGTTITAGKHLSRKLFAAVSWPLSFSGDSAPFTTTTQGSSKEIVIEYEFSRWLLARLKSDTSMLGLSLYYQYAY